MIAHVSCLNHPHYDRGPEKLQEADSMTPYSPASRETIRLLLGDSDTPGSAAANSLAHHQGVSA
jgi:hypothetical protein